MKASIDALICLTDTMVSILLMAPPLNNHKLQLHYQSVLKGLSLQHVLLKPRPG